MIQFQNDWDELLKEEFEQPYYLSLRSFLKEEYKTKTIYPPMGEIFSAFQYTPYEQVKVVILGQDPYINEGEAHGLSFSVKPGAKVPPSLRNIYKEITTDVGGFVPNNGYLVDWAKQGVLLLNTVLTVEQKKSKSHAGKGWETFTNNVITLLNKREEPIIFLLWGRDAQNKAERITNPVHHILTAAHPSPLANGKYFGSRHFSQTNDLLEAQGKTPIDWQIKNL